ncbi:MAG: sigma-70 family RNA polymerase sigma factor [bacterium]
MSPAHMSLDTARSQEFETLVLPMVRRLYPAALRMTRKEEAAEDLVQETLLRAWRFFDKFERGTNLKAWLFRIMTNLYITQYQKAQREPSVEELDALDQDYEHTVSAYLIDQDTNPERLALERVEREVVRAAVDQLPDLFRIPIVLCDLQGFSYKDIAEMLDVPIGTVMSRLFRGRKQLQLALMDYARLHGHTAHKEAAG